MNKKVTLNMKELKRHYVLQQIEDHQMTGAQAAQQLGSHCAKFGGCWRNIAQKELLV